MEAKLYSVIIGMVFSLSACNTYAPDITAVCSQDEVGNYILKWETDPLIDGTVKIYVSPDPGKFNRSMPVLSANIKDGVATYITDENIQAKYFLLSFKDKYNEIVGPRNIRMDSIRNLRDLGGYLSPKEGKSTRWGKVFRSASLSAMSERDTLRLDNLRIKTIIDLRSTAEAAKAPLHYSKAKIVHLPTSLGNLDDIYKKIFEGRVLKGDGTLYMQDLYLQFVTENKGQFSKAMEVFLDRNNYPILFNCTLGKDRTGFLAALLLLAVGVQQETVMHDYMESNNNMDLSRFNAEVLHLSTGAQEALTVILTANESYLKLALDRINKDYGSVPKYLTKELNISEKQQEELKELMLF